MSHPVKPLYQKMFLWIAWIIGGITALGALLDAYSNAVALITPPVAMVGTSLIATFLLSARWYLRRHPLRWVTKDNRDIKIIRLGPGITIPLLGIIAFLWLPSLIGRFQPLPFRPEAEGETLIVIATFHRAPEVMDAEPHREIRDAIRAAAKEVARVEMEPTILTVDDRADAEALGHQYNASMIIWGHETAVRLTINFLNLKEPDYPAAAVVITETERVALVAQSNPDPYRQFITTDLPGQLTFLALFAVGQSYYLNGTYAEAIPVIMKGIAALPPEAQPQGLAEAHYRLGWLYQADDQLAAAIAGYTQAIALDPKYAIAYNNRGIAYYDQGDLVAAIADYSQAIALDPKHALAYNNRGIAYYDQGDLAAAIADYSQAIDLDLEDANAYNNICWWGSLAGKAAEVMDACEEAVALAPDDGGKRDSRGLARALTGDYDGAIADFTVAVRMVNDHVVDCYRYQELA